MQWGVWVVEIAPVPHRATSELSGDGSRSDCWSWCPWSLLVLLPAVLGLDRYVITDSCRWTAPVGRGLGGPGPRCRAQ